MENSRKNNIINFEPLCQFWPNAIPSNLSHTYTCIEEFISTA